MAGYETVADATLTQIRALTNYSTTNADHHDLKFLNKAASDRVAMIRPGDSSHEYYAFAGGLQNTWDVMIDVYVRFKDTTQARNALRDETKAIRDRLNQYPKLNGTTGVLDAVIVEELEPEELASAGLNWFMQTLTLRVIEDEVVSLQE